LEQWSHKGVTVRTEEVVVPTYRMGAADPNPPFFTRGAKTVYPSSWQASFTEQIERRIYESVVAESKYMRVVFLPDWGMHLYRAIDLTTGRDMFHCPAVMKPANNGIRGAYVAGGVEFNFPVGHNVMTWSRTPLFVRATEEGVQILFHHVDQRTQMTVAAGVTVSADFRGIRFDQYFNNPTAVPQYWMYWINAGLSPHPSLRFLLPTDEVLGHFEGPFLETVTRYPYPIREGCDYSRYDEIPEPVGLFSPTSLAGWFGAYYEEGDYGVVRWAPPWQVPGQKVWSWGSSEEGLLWGKIAADLDLPIPEIQSGRTETQMDGVVLRPYDHLHHHEWWMPVQGIGEVGAASRFGSISLRPVGEKTIVGICPSSDVRACSIVINGRTAREGIRLWPGQIAQEHVDTDLEEIENLTIVSDTETLWTWPADTQSRSAHVETLYDHVESLSALGAEQLYLKGFRWERRRRQDLAERYYHMSLQKDPSFSKALMRLGYLRLRALAPEEALHYLERALRSDRWNDEALYLHGLASLWAGDDRQARADLTRTAASGDTYRLPALVELAKMFLRAGEQTDADSQVDQGLEIDSNNPTLLFIRSLRTKEQNLDSRLTQHLGRMDEAEGISLMGVHERDRAGVDQPFACFPAEASTEDDRLIAAAEMYAECGRSDRAAELLRRATSGPGQAKANYLLRHLGEDSPWPGSAGRFFGWGRWMKEALDGAVLRDGEDPHAHFALGCLLAELGRLDSAREHLAKAAQQRPDDSVVLTSLGRVCLESERPEEAAAALRKAIRSSPPNPLAWVELDNALDRLEQRDAEWLEAFANAPQEVLADERVKEALARLMIDRGQFDRAAELLSGTVFHPFELSHELRNLWVRAHRAKAIRQVEQGDPAAAGETIRQALAYPENLQLARPLRRFDAPSLYLAGWLAERAGQSKQAETYFREAAKEDQPDPTSARPWSVLAQLKLGETSDAMKRLDSIETQAQRYIDAEFQPDVIPTLRETIALCARIRSSFVPQLDDLRELLT